MPDPGPLKRPLYAPASGYKQSSPGDDIIAVKRAVSRAGCWRWQEFSDDYTNGFAFGDENGTGVLGVQKKRGIKNPSGNYGEKTHESLRKMKVPSGAEHAGEDVFDAKACELYKGHKVPSDGSAEQRVRDEIVEFCTRGLKAPQCWNYLLARPIAVSITPDKGEIYSDCSGSVIQAYHFAKRNTGLNVPDPAKQNWSGWGNTTYYEIDHPKVSGSYKIGDLGHYDGHVTLCMKAGDWNTSDWWSFGSEPPSKRKLDYRSDFLFVVRPKLIA
jgi:hypothetical protein